MSSSDHQDEWVSDLLADQGPVAIPESVSARIEDALLAGAEMRRANSDVDEAKRSYLEMRQRSALGTWGENAPAQYDKQGLGIEQ